MNKMFYKHYVFLEEINNLIKGNLIKFNGINIIIDIDQNDNKRLENQLSIIKFAKDNRIPFLIKNDFQNYDSESEMMDEITDCTLDFIKNNFKLNLLRIE